MKNNSLSGFSLIEVLVSLLLLAILFLGLEGGEIYALRESRNAWIVSIAVRQLENMTERLSVSNDVDNQLVHWNEENAHVLPQGRGTVTGQSPIYVISIYWGESNNQNPCQENHLGMSGCLQEKITMRS
jgi:prepilin-type N-terminal cleavage/methylation domain-containing protein